jgi:hypothetical protein
MDYAAPAVDYDSPETSGSLTGHILSQGRPDTSTGSTGRVIMIMLVALAAVVIITVIAVT